MSLALLSIASFEPSSLLVEIGFPLGYLLKRILILLGFEIRELDSLDLIINEQYHSIANPRRIQSTKL